MAFTTKYKDKDETKDYKVDWSEELGNVNDTISSVTWEVDSGITHDSDNDSNTNTTATIWLSAGTNGIRYKIICRITTASTPARIYDKTFYVKIREN